MIEDKLHEALLHTWFLEDENYRKQTQGVVATKSSFLNRYMLPQKMKDRVKQRLSHLKKTKVNGELVNEVYITARDCYRALADKLGDKKYFYGSKY